MAYVITDECVAADPVLLSAHLRQFLKAQIISRSMQTLALTAEHVQMFVLQSYPARRIIQRTTYRKRRAAAKLRLFFIFIYSYVFSGFFLIFYPLKRQRLRVWQAAVF